MQQSTNVVENACVAVMLWTWPDLVQFHLGSRAPGSDWATEALDKLRWLDLQPGNPLQPVKVPLAADALPLLEAFAQDLQQRQTEALQRYGLPLPT